MNRIVATVQTDKFDVENRCSIAVFTDSHTHERGNEGIEHIHADFIYFYISQLYPCPLLFFQLCNTRIYELTMVLAFTNKLSFV